MGIITVWSHWAMVPSASPSPSVPSTTASLSADNRRGSSSRRESSRRAMAAVVKPRSCSAAVQSPSGR